MKSQAGEDKRSGEPEKLIQMELKAGPAVLNNILKRRKQSIREEGNMSMRISRTAAAGIFIASLTALILSAPCMADLLPGQSVGSQAVEKASGGTVDIGKIKKPYVAVFFIPAGKENETQLKKLSGLLAKKEFKSLIGTLMHAVKKTEKLTENGKKNIADVLNEKLQEKEVKKQKKQERITKKQRDESDAQQKEEERIMQEMIVDSILNTIFSDLRTDKENTKSVGEKLTREELEDIFTEAWKQFLEQKP